MFDWKALLNECLNYMAMTDPYSYGYYLASRSAEVNPGNGASGTATDWWAWATSQRLSTAAAFHQRKAEVADG